MHTDEPCFPDDSESALAEEIWSNIEHSMEEKTMAFQKKITDFSHFSCPDCNSADTQIISEKKRRRTTYVQGNTKDFIGVDIQMRRDIGVLCANCLCEWTEEVPDHEPE